MSFFQLDTVLFECQLQQSGHPGFEKCLVITRYMLARGSREFSHPQRQIQMPNFQKEFLKSEEQRDGLIRIEVDLLLVNQQDQDCCLHLTFLQRIKNWETVINTNFVKIRHFTAILTVDNMNKDDISQTNSQQGVTCSVLNLQILKSNNSNIASSIQGLCTHVLTISIFKTMSLIFLKIFNINLAHSTSMEGQALSKIKRDDGRRERGVVWLHVSIS